MHSLANRSSQLSSNAAGREHLLSSSRFLPNKNGRAVLNCSDYVPSEVPVPSDVRVPNTDSYSSSQNRGVPPSPVCTISQQVVYSTTRARGISDHFITWNIFLLLDDLIRIVNSKFSKMETDFVIYLALHKPTAYVYCLSITMQVDAMW